MTLAKIAAFVIRGLQILFGAVVLSAGKFYGHVQATNGYSAFAGGIAILTGLAGLTACFILKLERPMLLVDALTAVLLFAGSISYAVQLKGVNCGDALMKGTFENKLINGGRKMYDDDRAGYGYGDDTGLLLRHCKMAEANATFLFLGFLTAVAALVIGVLAFGKAKRSQGRRV